MILTIDNDEFTLSFSCDIMKSKRRLNKLGSMTLDFQINSSSNRYEKIGGFASTTEEWFDNLVLPELIKVATNNYCMIILDPVITSRRSYTKKYSFGELTNGVLDIKFSKLIGSHDVGILKSDIREHKLNNLGI